MRYISYFLIIFYFIVFQVDNACSQPDFELGEISINDYSGNVDDWIDPGETILIHIPVTNTGVSTGFDVVLTLSTANPDISVYTQKKNYGTIDPGETFVQQFYVTADYFTNQYYIATMVAEITATGNIYVLHNFELEVDKVTVLIVDKEVNNFSSDAIENALNSLNYDFDRMDTVPSQLQKYKSVFGCLGVRDLGEALSMQEGTYLADYLDISGRLYLEGGDTWFHDPQTEVHPYFNINALDDGSSNLVTVEGEFNTLAHGMNFSYSGDVWSIDHIEAVSPAELLFKSPDPFYGIGVLHDGGYYKTVGCSYEFGGLEDGTTISTKQELMYRYLEFFDISPLDLEAKFVADDPFLCEGDQVQYINYSVGDIQTYDWQFPGGVPSSSTEENPLITYPDEGKYVVSLTVGDGTNFHSLIRYIYILVSPNASASLSGDTSICNGDTANVIIELQGIPPYQFTVSDGSNNYEFEDEWNDSVVLKVAPSQDRSYFMTYLTDAAGCQGFFHDTVDVNVMDGPEAYITGLQNVCPGEPANFPISLSGIPPMDIYFSTGDHVHYTSGLLVYQYYADSTTGITIDSVSDASGCDGLGYGLGTINVINPPQITITNDTTLCAADSILLQAYAPGAVSFLWTPGNFTSPGMMVDSSGIGFDTQTWVLHVEDADGCVNSDSVTVTFIDCPGIQENYSLKEQIQLYPNPVRDLISVQTEFSGLRYSIYNTSGILLSYQADLTDKIDVSYLERGIYFVRIEDERGGIVVKRIVKL